VSAIVAAIDSDVYVCPYLMWADKRAKGAAVAHRVVHVDYDGAVDLDKVRAAAAAKAPMELWIDGDQPGNLQRLLAWEANQTAARRTPPPSVVDLPAGHRSDEVVGRRPRTPQAGEAS
jgi:hypothetical protein